MDYGWLSLAPPLLAIALALVVRQVHLALFVGLWLGTTILAAWDPLAGVAMALDYVIAVLGEPGSAQVLLFMLLVGGMIRLMTDSGGVLGFGEWMVERGLVRGPRSAQLFTALLGVTIFIESTITCLVTGTVSRPLYDRVGLSRAKLAYICDSTSAPICMLLPLNAWGAMVLSLLVAQGVDNPVAVLVGAVPLNFYALLAFGLVLVVAVTGWDFGPMARAEATARVLASARDRSDDAGEESTADAAATGSPAGAAAGGSADGAVASGDAEARSGEAVEGFEMPDVPGRPRNLVVPVLVTVGMMPAGLLITGDGDWMAGSGETAVLWAVMAGLAAVMLMTWWQGQLSWAEMTDRAVQGMQELLGVTAILALALAIGAICDDLGTGTYVTQTVAPWIGPATVAPLVFLAGAVISFSTGSSWGTFAIIMPIAIPMAMALGASLSLTTAAVMGGGVFGDHCSPISDTTVISSLSAGCDHIEHVSTQIPYALLAGTAATALYFLAGFVV